MGQGKARQVWLIFQGNSSMWSPFSLRSVTVETHAGTLVWSSEGSLCFASILETLTHEKTIQVAAEDLTRVQGSQMLEHIWTASTVKSISQYSHRDRSLFSILSHPSIVCFISLNLNSFQPNHPPSTFPPRGHLPRPTRLSKANSPVQITHLWPVEPDYLVTESETRLDRTCWFFIHPTLFFYHQASCGTLIFLFLIRRHSYTFKNQEWQCLSVFSMYFFCSSLL